MEAIELYKLLIDTYQRANTTLQSEVEYLKAENRYLRQKLNQEMLQQRTIPPDLRSRYRKVNCRSVDELMEKIRETCKETTTKTVEVNRVQSEEEVHVGQSSTTTLTTTGTLLQTLELTTTPSVAKDELMQKLGLDISSTSSSDESGVLSISASPLNSASDSETIAVTIPTQKPNQKRRAILHQQALQEPPKASVRERIDRHGRDHGRMMRTAKFINPITPLTNSQRCPNCRQRNRHLSSCSRR